MDFIFHPRGLGFRKKGDWRSIVDVPTCPISNPAINALLAELRNAFTDVDAFDPKRHTGTFRYAVIRAPPGDSSVSFVLNADSMKLGEAIDRIKAYAQVSTANNIVVTRVPAQTDVSIAEDFFVVKGKDKLEESFLGKKFHYGVQGFFQNNHTMAESMQRYVRDVLTSYANPSTHLFDLYGGVGTFGIVNADQFKRVTIVEGYAPAITCADENVRLNGITNGMAQVLDDSKFKRLEFPMDSVVVTDPPRSGMHPKAIEALNAALPKVIVYISCNIEQLARDVPKFSKYIVKSAALFDLFPHTPHCEGVAVFERK